MLLVVNVVALYPSATQRPWKPYNPERFITPRVVIVHTNAVNAEDPNSAGGLSWHFQVGEHGTVYEHRDTATRAAANYQANNFAISIETWDGGNPEGNPWNAEQMNALVALVGWCCDTHGIPRHIPNAWDGTGVGFHRMHSEWNNPVHSCPGNTRAAQFYDELLPRLQAPTPAPTPTEEEPHMFVVKGDATPEWWLTDFVTRRHIVDLNDAGVVRITFARNNAPLHYDPAPNNGMAPIILPQASVDAIATAGAATGGGGGPLSVSLTGSLSGTARPV